MGPLPIAMLAKTVLLLLAASAYAHDFKSCGTENLGITACDVNPDSPIPGQNLTVSFTATPKQDVVSGDKYTITVKLFGVALGHVDFDFCTELGVTCPVKAGTATKFTSTYDVPKAAPSGVALTAEFTAKNAAGTQYSCVDVDVTMGKPPSTTPMRRDAVMPLQETSQEKFDAWIHQLLDLEKNDPVTLAKEIRESPYAAIAPVMDEAALAKIAVESTNGIPTVVAHGMGDSCFNPGMKSITQAIGQKTGAYSVCVPTGNNDIMDTINGFLKSMDDSIDVFAKKIQADPKLANGFNAAGFSQGNSLIRGYVQKYNNPPVKSFLSVHGTVMGVGGLPQCNPAGLLGVVCRPIAELCGTLGYTSLVQKHLFQADYFRDPTKLDKESYKNSQQAQLNNEGDSPNPDYKTNFGKTEQFVMVKAMGDTMVFPNEGEHWGTFGDGSFDKSKVLTMKETNVYKNDLFGLKTADEAGKIKFETTPGNHLQFTEEQLFGWISKYWTSSSKAPLTLTISKEWLTPNANANSSHYEDPKPNGCLSDEQAIQIQGVTGDFCTPKCTGILKMSCPQDLPDGVTAKPQCALKDTSGNKYCALICTPGSNDACGKATCKAIQGVGICTYDD